MFRLWSDLVNQLREHQDRSMPGARGEAKRLSILGNCCCRDAQLADIDTHNWGDPSRRPTYNSARSLAGRLPGRLPAAHVGRLLVAWTGRLGSSCDLDSRAVPKLGLCFPIFCCDDTHSWSATQSVHATRTLLEFGWDPATHIW